MTFREERLAKNEAVVREINEDIEDSHEAASRDGHFRMLCECGHTECERLIAITLPEYERVREDGRHFAVVGEHVIPDVERVIWDTDRFVVVEKLDGPSADVAIETDPRG